MNKDASHLLIKILAKEVQALTESDISFMKARITYLQPEDLEKFASVLDEKPKKVAKPAPTTTTPTAPKVVDNSPKYSDLIAQAKSMGLKVRIGMKKEQIQDMILQNS